MYFNNGKMPESGRVIFCKGREGRNEGMRCRSIRFLIIWINVWGGKVWFEGQYGDEKPLAEKLN